MDQIINYFENRKNRQFFRQNAPSGGTYLECWSQSSGFSHILSTVELGSPEKLQRWLRLKKLIPGTAEDYDDHFFQLCREIKQKHERKAEQKDKHFKDTL